jgi:hypothetical protein
MKAENLMNGDWVMSFGQVTEVWMVDTSHEDEEDQLINYLDASEFEPIPLTPKILEKNSFLKVESIVYDEPRIGVSYLYRDTPEGLRIFVQNACVGGPTCTMIKTCKYVHEVQHMIKMCDIEKTFVL